MIGFKSDRPKEPSRKSILLVFENEDKNWVILGLDTQTPRKCRLHIHYMSVYPFYAPFFDSLWGFCLGDIGSYSFFI